MPDQYDQYEFVVPRIRRSAESSHAPHWTLRPHAPTYEVLDQPTCSRLADIVIDAYEAGQGWASRTRYAATTAWDVNQEFRRSKNLPARLEGLATAYEAMQVIAAGALDSFGIDAHAHRLHMVDEQCIVYHEGDHIADHADDSALSASEEETCPAWEVIKPERHLVGILWLTTQTLEGKGRHEFAGGSLRFNSLLHRSSGQALSIEPVAGTMTLFPANPWYRHEVLKVTAGTRIALTRWWEVRRADGTPLGVR